MGSDRGVGLGDRLVFHRRRLLLDGLLGLGGLLDGLRGLGRVLDRLGRRRRLLQVGQFGAAAGLVGLRRVGLRHVRGGRVRIRVEVGLLHEFGRRLGGGIRRSLVPGPLCGAECLVLELLQLRRIRAVCPLQLKMLFDRVVENAHWKLPGT